MREQHDRLSDLLDRDAIRVVLCRYFTALDARDWPVVAECFTHDASAVYDGVRLAGGRAALRDALESGGAQGAAGVAAPRLWTHLPGPSDIVVHGDRATAATSAIAHIVHRRSDGDETMLVRGIRYLDVLTRAGGRWLIAERVHTCDWMREELSVLGSVDFATRVVRP
jgi:hypothetical protein